MLDFNDGDRIRFLPCMHTYHVHCIDDWLMRSFTCPSCMEPVDSALLTSYDQQAMTGNSSFDQLEQLTAANNNEDRAISSTNAAAADNQNTSSTLARSFNNDVFEGENEN